MAKSTHYRTMCVRTCDGYYWPISYSIARSALGRDASVCKSSCDTEARLFYQPKSESDVKSMVDLTGRAYGQLSTAYQYRRSLVSGCTCKPAPWSLGEIDRHRQYAAAEQTDASSEQPAETPTKSEAAVGGVTPSSPPAEAKSPKGTGAVTAGTASNSGEELDPSVSSAPKSPKEKSTRQAQSPAPATRTAATRSAPLPAAARPEPASSPKVAAKSTPSHPTRTSHRQTQLSRSATAVTSRPASAPIAAGPGFGLGGPKLRWPGD